jgi:hypothetical protein
MGHHGARRCGDKAIVLAKFYPHRPAPTLKDLKFGIAGAHFKWLKIFGSYSILLAILTVGNWAVKDVSFPQRRPILLLLIYWPF